MIKYNELLIDEDQKIMELFTGLSVEEDQTLSRKVSSLIQQGKNIRLQVIAVDKDENTLYIEGYTLVKGLLETL
ncbi:hypothetical protein LNQ81_16890 [Myroides sp. M-43]|uniref:hypothetical protein n=1 Tax=Myroides oncorhynchi TaxID=2893756 RepID=UPI001E5CD092|nr:hypothetical protein [Myroides oncorhynchi]MCC9044351.1 hypothetical protein [Myroides oncorhynchi]